jgi:hypothetical protein
LTVFYPAVPCSVPNLFLDLFPVAEVTPYRETGIRSRRGNIGTIRV